LTNAGAGGVAEPEQRQRAAERKRQALQLRCRGLTFEAIAIQIGISKQAAHRLYRQALREIPKAELTEEEKDEFMRLLAKIRGYYVEPPTSEFKPSKILPGAEQRPLWTEGWDGTKAREDSRRRRERQVSGD